MFSTYKEIMPPIGEYNGRPKSYRNKQIIIPARSNLDLICCFTHQFPKVNHISSFTTHCFFLYSLALFCVHFSLCFFTLFTWSLFTFTFLCFSKIAGQQFCIKTVFFRAARFLQVIYQWQFIGTDKWNGCESYPDACIHVLLPTIPLSCAPQLQITRFRLSSFCTFRAQFYILFDFFTQSF